MTAFYARSTFELLVQNENSLSKRKTSLTIARPNNTQRICNQR